MVQKKCDINFSFPVLGYPLLAGIHNGSVCENMSLFPFPGSLGGEGLHWGGGKAGKGQKCQSEDACAGVWPSSHSGSEQRHAETLRPTQVVLPHQGARPPQRRGNTSGFCTFTAFSRRWIQSNLKWFMQTFKQWRWSQPRQTTASPSGAVRVSFLTQGHLDTQLGGGRDRTSRLANWV